MRTNLGYILQKAVKNYPHIKQIGISLLTNQNLSKAITGLQILIPFMNDPIITKHAIAVMPTATPRPTGLLQVQVDILDQLAKLIPINQTVRTWFINEFQYENSYWGIQYMISYFNQFPYEVQEELFIYIWQIIPHGFTSITNDIIRENKVKQIASAVPTGIPDEIWPLIQQHVTDYRDSYSWKRRLDIANFLSRHPNPEIVKQVKQTARKAIQYNSTEEIKPAYIDIEDFSDFSAVIRKRGTMILTQLNK